MRLEPCAVKIASTVLRGRSASNGTLLPDESDAARIILFGSMVAKVIKADAALVILTVIETDFLCDD